MSFLVKEVLAAAPPCVDADGNVVTNPTTPCAVPITGFENVFANVLGVILSLSGVVFFVLLISAGFTWMTSSGDPQKIASARNTLTYAIAGLTLTALAYLIIALIATITGVEAIKTFRIVITP